MSALKLFFKSTGNSVYLHEYQSKDLLLKYGICSPDYVLIDRVGALPDALEQLDTSQVVLKAQVHARSRRAAGAVQFARNESEAAAAARALLGMRVRSASSGKEGLVVQKLMVTPWVQVASEGYLALTFDRVRQRCVLLATPCGGEQIEVILRRSPEQVLSIDLYRDRPFESYQVFNVAMHMGWLEQNMLQQSHQLLQGLIRLFFEEEATLIELNPLATTQEGVFTALDARILLDDHAEFRHADRMGLFDPVQWETPALVARSQGFCFLPYAGSIGVVANGAGLAMATVDALLNSGGEPAYLLDLGAEALPATIEEGMALLSMAPPSACTLVHLVFAPGAARCGMEALAAAAASASHVGTLVCRCLGEIPAPGESSSLPPNMEVYSDWGKATQRALEIANKKRGAS